ncbi:hypothetical protein ACFQE1_01785 [Halobium palmae]|uniref:Uncharacterized protein n=1 Tax=Halobium palmae TaxID=1776492 RepID=A0ABD5RUX4_9EURY
MTKYENWKPYSTEKQRVESLDDMSDLTIEILVALKNEDGSATTSELATLTGAESDKVKYRYKKLEEKYELVTVDRQGVRENGVALPNVVSLTETCQDIVESVDLSEYHDGEQGAERPTTQRLDELERDLNVLESHVGSDVRDRLDQQEAVIAGLVRIVQESNDMSLNDLPGNAVVEDAVMGDRE